MEFEQVFTKNAKGNYFSHQNKCTIYYSAGFWYYNLTKNHLPVYGRKQFKSALDCFNYLVKKHLLTAVGSTTVAYLKDYSEKGS